MNLWGQWLKWQLRPSLPVPVFLMKCSVLGRDAEISWTENWTELNLWRWTWSKFVAAIDAPRNVKIFLRSTLLLNRNRHNWSRFFVFWYVFITHIIFSTPLPYCCSGVPEIRVNYMKPGKAKISSSKSCFCFQRYTVLMQPCSACRTCYKLFFQNYRQTNHVWEFRKISCDDCSFSENKIKSRHFNECH